MVCRRATYFVHWGMIEYYQKVAGEIARQQKVKDIIYLRNYVKYTTLKNHFLWFMLGHITVMRISK